MRNRREKRIHIFGEEILRVLFAGQGGYHAMFPELRVFAHPLFFDIQNGAGDALLIEPRFEIEAGGKEQPGNGSEVRSEEHTSELQSHLNLVCRLLLEKKKQTT